MQAFSFAFEPMRRILHTYKMRFRLDYFGWFQAAQHMRMNTSTIFKRYLEVLRN